MRGELQIFLNLYKIEIDIPILSLALTLNLQHFADRNFAWITLISRHIKLAPAQVRHVARRITPDEYDAAALRSPSSVPLRAMGDWRTGRELLADADADLAAPLLPDKRGNCLRFFNYLHSLVACPERFGAISNLVMSSPKPDLQPARWAVPARWAAASMMPYWNMGVRPDALAGALDGLPPRHQDLLRYALVRGGPPQRRSDVMGRRVGAEGGAGVAGGPLQEPGELWEGEGEVGFLSVAYDAATGQRRGVAMNPRQVRNNLLTDQPCLLNGPSESFVRL